MGELLEKIYGVLFQPSTTLRDICRQKPLQQSIIVLIFITFLTTWTGYFTVLGNSAFLFGILMVTLVMWFSSSAIAHLAAELLGGSGQAKGLLAANGFIQIPRIFTVPVLVIVLYLPISLRNLLLIIVGLGLFIWEVILGIIAIRECYGFSTGKAILTLVAPYAVIVLPLIAFAMIAAAVMIKITSMLGSDMFPLFMQ